MKVIRVREFGGPEVLRLEDADDPIAKKDEVVIRVKAAGVNPYEMVREASVIGVLLWGVSQLDFLQILAALQAGLSGLVCERAQRF